MSAIDYTNSEIFACPKPPKTKKKKPKPINMRTKKMNKLERDRDKEIVKSGRCEYCKKISKRLDPHEVYGGSNRQRSIQNKFVKKLCRKCHMDEFVLRELKKIVQKEFEEEHSREEFISIIGKSYL